MENYDESTLKKIKQKEQENSIKIKEKVKYDIMVMTLNRGIHEATTQAAKRKHDITEAVSRTDELRSRLESEKSRWQALSGVLENANNQLKAMQDKSVHAVSTVWNTRSSLCKNVQEVSDQCDVWALFSKPKSIQMPVKNDTANEPIKQFNANDDRLNSAIERRRKLQAERDRLQNEPESGKDFLRIKNALQYSATVLEKYK